MQNPPQTPPQSHGQNLRKGRYSQPGQIYLVTAVTKNRLPVFASFDAARMLIKTMQTEASMGHADTLAFVVMPDHLHWLLALGEKSALSTVVRSVKSVSAHQIGGKLWQRGFHDRALRLEENVLDAARYVIANPVRAGLVAKVGDYSHWDAAWL